MKKLVVYYVSIGLWHKTLDSHLEPHFHAFSHLGKVAFTLLKGSKLMAPWGFQSVETRFSAALQGALCLEKVLGTAAPTMGALYSAGEIGGMHQISKHQSTVNETSRISCLGTMIFHIKLGIFISGVLLLGLNDIPKIPALPCPWFRGLRPVGSMDDLYRVLSLRPPNSPLPRAQLEYWVYHYGL